MDKLNKPVVIIGFGGHGRVVASALLDRGQKVIAATDRNPESQSSDKIGFDLITDEQLIERFQPAEVCLVNGVGSILPVSDASPRACLVKRFVDLGYDFIGFQHSTAWVSPQASVSPTAQIHAGAIVQPGSMIGEHVILNTRASIDHDCEIGDFCHIAPGVTVSGNVKVGNGCHVGVGATIIQGLTIGETSLVAAGALVVKDVEANSRIKGVPAKPFQLRKN